MAGSIGLQERKAFKDLLIIDSLRGPHSTGVLLVNSQKKTHVSKVVGDPFELLLRSNYTSNLNGINKVMIGHNRYATKGAINKVNAHPFEFDNVIGAHNGTLTTQYLLDDWSDYEVDSENLYYHLDKHGVKETTKKLGGAYALTWWDKSDDTINLLRNDQRPLHYTYSKDGNTIFWASEVWMLEGALGRNGVLHGEIFDLPIHVHFKQRIEFPNGSVTKAMPKATLALTEAYKPPAKVNTNNNVSKLPAPKEGGVFAKIKKLVGNTVEFYTQGESKNKGGLVYISARTMSADNLPIRLYSVHNKEVHELLKSTEKDFSGRITRVVDSNGDVHGVIDISSVVEIEDGVGNVTYFDGYDGELLTEEEWLRRTANGCSWCLEIATQSEQDELVWIDDNNHVCACCAQQEQVKKYF